MGFTLGQVRIFLAWFIFFLVANSIFVLFASLAAYGASDERPPLIWLIGNLIVLGYFAVLLLTPVPNPFFENQWGALFVLGIAAGRTIADYAFAWHYYFPPVTSLAAPAVVPEENHAPEGSPLPPNGPA